MTSFSPLHSAVSAERLLAAARVTEGFMPEEEGLALTHLAASAARSRLGPVVEIGAYCGRSTLFLAAGLASVIDREPSCALWSIDHHHGSEELQAGWPHHDPTLVDPVSGRMDSLFRWRRAIEAAGAEGLVVGVVADSLLAATGWSRPCALVFIDGGHAPEVVRQDYDAWSPFVAKGGILAFHDVFAEPAQGGQGPYLCVQAALGSGRFEELAEGSIGSLKALRCVERD
jgi:predicted O-methyltransferase YrrM